ncbi:glutathione S-transferase kappa 1 [Patellaria atrata CBS 101060]|uniref:Glutathione S-transferase kappa n=1 Tax=Patellaria atrata CBS 101060 TaxID=1346257 RepID=A0A9P4S8F8_9PEZI|nr:glutathione S-transferase kappa 1 [Patellaria atrata CBS 101060]
MGRKIEAYLDCVSPYSYFAFLHLQRHEEVLRSHNVEIEYIPVFLGGINVGSGNKPPWTLPAKGKYSSYDTARAKKYFGVPNLRTPSFFPILSLLPQRCMTHVKHAFPQIYASSFGSLWAAMWEEGLDISKPELMAQTLRRHFSPIQVEQVMEAAGSKEVKDELLATTRRCVEEGAFGCPWFMVTNGEGKREPFFGSDRWVFMWEFLGLEWKDVEICPGTELKSKI